MNTEIISLVIFGCVVGAVLMGRTLSRRLPEDHLSADTKETASRPIASERHGNILLRIANQPMLNVLSQLEKST